VSSPRSDRREARAGHGIPARRDLGEGVGAFGQRRRGGAHDIEAHGGRDGQRRCEREIDRRRGRATRTRPDQIGAHAVAIAVAKALAAQLDAGVQHVRAERTPYARRHAAGQREVAAVLCAESELRHRIAQRLALDEHVGELARPRLLDGHVAAAIEDEIERRHFGAGGRLRDASRQTLLLPDQARAARALVVADPRRRIDLIELVVATHPRGVVGDVERRTVIGEEREIAAGALIAHGGRRQEFAVIVAVVHAGVARAIRTTADRRVQALAALAATEPRHQVHRAADTGAAELDRDRAAIQLDLTERVHREPSEIDGDLRELRERHVIDEHRGVTGRRPAHADRRERTEPAEAAPLRACRCRDRVRDRRRRRLLVGVKDGDERRIAERPRPIASGAILNLAFDDDRLALRILRTRRPRGEQHRANEEK
jgi:hypothetical protein